MIFKVTYPNGTTQEIVIPYEGNLFQKLEKLKDFMFNESEIEIVPEKIK